MTCKPSLSGCTTGGRRWKTQSCPLPKRQGIEVKGSVSYFSLTRLRESLMRKAGPNFFMLRLGGNKSSVRAPRTFAKMYNSPSGTRRCSVSSLASDSRLTSHPNSWSFADKSYCVQPLRSRSFRTWRPIKFNGNEACLMWRTVTKLPGRQCSTQVTLCLPSWIAPVKNHSLGRTA